MTHDPELYQALGKLEGKIEALILLSNKQDGRMEKIETRLGVVESFQTRATAYVAGGSAVAGTVAAFLTRLF